MCYFIGTRSNLTKALFFLFAFSTLNGHLTDTCLLLGPSRPNWWSPFAFSGVTDAPEVSRCLGASQLLSPHPCFITVVSLLLIFSRDDTLMSLETSMRVEQPTQLFKPRRKMRVKVGTRKKTPPCRSFVAVSFLCPRDDSQGALRFAPVVRLSVCPFVTLYSIEFL